MSYIIELSLKIPNLEFVTFQLTLRKIFTQNI